MYLLTGRGYKAQAEHNFMHIKRVSPSSYFFILNGEAQEKLNVSKGS